MEYTIYSIAYPLTGVVFYVGQTKNFTSRKKSHLSSCHNDDARKIIDDIKFINQEPLFSILDKCPADEADKSELQWINYFKDNNVLLCNKQVGRPTIEKDPNRKQMNVMVSGATQKSEVFKERVKYMSFSAYVNSLIDNDIANV